MVSLKQTTGRTAVIAVFVLCCVAQSSALNRFTNYSSIIRINDVLFDNGNALLASSGGLFSARPGDTSGTMVREEYPFPDLNLTSLEKDGNGRVWAGTQQGYLYRLGDGGQFKRVEDYKSAGWDIAVMCRYEQFLLVGSSRGFSIFDPEGNLPSLNATEFAKLGAASVLSISLHKDSLYLGTTKGVATLALASGLRSYNYFDPSIWTVQSTQHSVKDIIFEQQTVRTYATPALRWNNRIIHADSSSVMVGTDTLNLLSNVIRFVAEDESTIWIGTEDNFVFRWQPGVSLVQFSANGLTFNGIDRVLVSRTDGRVWLMPFPSRAILSWSPYSEIPQPWYKRITTFDGNQWNRFDSLARLGTGLQSYLHGLVEDTQGNMWIGTNGFQMYRYDKTLRTFELGVVGRGVCFAVAQDSSGYLWAANDDNGGPHISLICVKPGEAGFAGAVKTEYFGPDSPYYIRYIYKINVDKKGTVWVGGQDGKLAVFRHNGHPERGESAITNSDVISSAGYVYDIEVMGDNTTVLGSANGLFLINMEAGYYARIENVPAPVKAVEVESDRVLWVGTNEGLVQVELPLRNLQGQNLFGFPSQITTDTATTTSYKSFDGLVDETITDMSIDKARGVLWIATPNGLSKFDLGHSFSTVTNNEKTVAYPNPFSLSRHDELVIRNVAPDSRVDIFSSSGTSIARATPLEQLKNNYAWTFRWKPSTDLAPGTYFYRAAPEGKVKKIFLVP